MFNFQNPIPQAIRDTDEKGRLLKKYNIVPYYGNEEHTSHSMLGFISDLAEMSPSHVSCIKAIFTYAFGGALSGQKRAIPGLRQRSPEVGTEQEDAFFAFWQKMGVSPIKIRETTRLLFEMLRDTGNAYLHIKCAKVGESRRVEMQCWHPSQAGILWESDQKGRHVVLTPYWDENSWKERKPLVLPLSYIDGDFSWKETSTTFETVVHFLKRDKMSPYYGRPEILSVLNPMFAEYRMFDLNAKIAGHEMTAKFLLLIQELNPERQAVSDKDPKKPSDGFKERINAIRRLTTSEGSDGEISSIAAMKYPFDGVAPTIEKFEVNRDVDYAQWTTESAASVIYAVHEWSKELTGQIPIRAGVGANMLYDLFLTKIVSVIRPLQDVWEGNWSAIFTQVETKLGLEPQKVTVKFTDLIEELVDAIQGVNIEQGNNPLQRAKQSASGLRP